MAQKEQTNSFNLLHKVEYEQITEHCAITQKVI